VASSIGCWINCLSQKVEVFVKLLAQKMYSFSDSTIIEGSTYHSNHTPPLGSAREIKVSSIIPPRDDG